MFNLLRILFIKYYQLKDWLINCSVQNVNSSQKMYIWQCIVVQTVGAGVTMAWIMSVAIWHVASLGVGPSIIIAPKYPVLQRARILSRWLRVVEAPVTPARLLVQGTRLNYINWIKSHAISDIRVYETVVIPFDDPRMSITRTLRNDKESAVKCGQQKLRWKYLQIVAITLLRSDKC